jgi:hypothetical protein
MTDYFVDFSLGTNGDGSVTSPWSQFTTSEHTTISGGDFIWFRRINPGIDNNLITLLAGPSDNNKIKYIGWPLNGDTYYTNRPTPPSNDWETDTEQYVYQVKSNSDHSSYIINLESNLELHRFCASQLYSSVYCYTPSYLIKNQQNVIIKHCDTHIDNGLIPYPYEETALISIQYSSNVFVININLDSTVASLNIYGYKILNSNYVTFSGVSMYLGDSVSTYAPRPSEYSDMNNNYSRDSNNIVFNNCSFFLGLCHDNAVAEYGGKYSPTYNRYISCDVKYLNCSFKFNNVNNNPTNLDFRKNCIFTAIKSEDSTIYLENNYIEITQGRSSFLDIQGVSDIICKNTYINCSNITQNVLFQCASNTYTNILIDTISGTYYKGTQTLRDSNYLLSFNDWEIHSNNKFNITNIPLNFGAILDKSTQIFKGELTSDKLISLGTVHCTTISQFKLKNKNLSNLILYTLDNNTDYFIPGNSETKPQISIENCNISKTPLLAIDKDNYTEILIATLYNNTGTAGAVFEDNSNTNYRCVIKAIRNNGFTHFGSDTSTQEERLIMNSLNTYDYGNTSFSSKEISYSTSDINRLNGAGYSIKIIKRENDALSVYYPILGEDNVWVHIPDPGTYTVTVYATYTTSSGDFTNNDIIIQIDVTNSINEIYKSSTIENDTNSTWNNITSNTTIKFNITFTVSSAQYCSIRVILNKWQPEMCLYLDPKAEVTKN